MNIGFIGTGNMAQAILKGLTEKHPELRSSIYLSSLHIEHCQTVAKEFHVQSVSDNLELTKKADLIILAVKPATAPQVLAEIGSAFNDSSKILISIAAGLTIEKLHGYTKNTHPFAIVRTMPNLPASIGLGATAICPNEQVSPEQLAAVKLIFQAIGEVYSLAEKDFDIFSAIAGSSPAFVFLFIDALARAGVKYGLSKKEATEIVTQSVFGSAQLLAKSDQHPWTLIDQVCSPGGTTVEGILSLEKNAFSGIIVDCIDATFSKNKEIEKKSD